MRNVNTVKSNRFVSSMRSSKSGNRSLARKVALFSAALASCSAMVRANNTADTVNTNASAALDTASNYSLSQLPGTTNDMEFTSSTYTNTPFTLNVTALTPGTLDDLDTTQALSITGSKSITLSGGSDSVAGSQPSDLFYLSGGSLSVSTPLVLAASGNIDVAGSATFGGLISDSSGTDFGLVKTGAGTLNITLNTNNYTGGTTVNAGRLQFATTSNGSLVLTPFGTGPITLNGGTLSLEIGGQNNSSVEFYQLSNQVVLTGNGTLALNRDNNGGNKIVQINSLNLGANTLTSSNSNGYDLTVAGLTQFTSGATLFDNSVAGNGGLASDSLNALTVSNSATTGTNSVINLHASSSDVPINLVGRVTNNPLDNTKTVGLNFTGGTTTNVLDLRSNNSFSGGITATGGVVRLNNASAPGTGNIDLVGAVLEGTRDYNSFTQTLGTGAGSIDLAGAGSGFSAYGAPVTVDLNGGSTLVWNSTAGFNLGSGNLILDGSTASQVAASGYGASNYGQLTFQNGIDLDGGTRTIETDSSTANISGSIINSVGTGTLSKAGGNIGNAGGTYDNQTVGILVLSGSNTTFSSQVNIVAGELSIASQSNIGTGTINLSGGALQITGTTPASLSNTVVSGNNNLGFDIVNPGETFTLSGSTQTFNIGGNSFYKLGAGTLNYAGTAGPNTVNLFEGGNTTQTANVFNGTLNLTSPTTPTANLVSGSGSIYLFNANLGFLPSGTGNAVTFTSNDSNAIIKYNGAAGIELNKGSETSLTFNSSANPAAAAFSRNASGSTLLLSPNGGFATFGSSESMTFNTAPTLITGTDILSPAIFVQDTSTNSLNGDFVTTSGTGKTLLHANGNLLAANTDTNFAAATAAKVEYASGTQNAPSAATVGDLVNSGALTIASGSSLTVAGTGQTQEGVILNGGSILGGSSTSALAFGANEGIVYFNGQNTNAISSVITGSGGLTILGGSGGLLTLGSANANTFSGTDTINGGTVKLAASSVNALGAANNTLTINAGTLDINANNIANAVGPLNGTVEATLTNSNATVGTLTIGGNNGTGGIFSGAVTGNINIVKGGSGIQIFDGANTFSGLTNINNGAINFGANLAGLSSNSAILLGSTAGGTDAVLAGTGTFTDSLGTLAGQIKFVPSNNTNDQEGFAALGGPLTVNIGNAGATLMWNGTGTGGTGGTANFLTSNALAFGYYSGTNGTGSDNRVTLVNNLDINGGNRTVDVNTSIVNGNSFVSNVQYGYDDALISGNLLDSSSTTTVNADSFTKSGNSYNNISNGVLQLGGTASNLGYAEFNAGAGITEFVSGASLTTFGSLNITDKVIVDLGATVAFGGSGGLSGATSANYVGNNSTAENTLEIDGGVANFNNSTTGTGNGWLFGGANSGTADGAIDLTSGTLRVGTYLALASTPSGTNGNAPLGNNSIFSLNIDSGSVIIGGGTGTGTGVTGSLYLKGAASDINATAGQAIVNLNGGLLSLTQIVMGGTTGSESVVNLNGGTLQANGASQTYANFIAAPSAASGGEYVVGTGGAVIDSNSNNITIAAPLLGTSGDGGLTKVGSGTLYLTAANTFNGGTFIKAGTLNVNADAAFGTSPASPATNITFAGNSTLQFAGSFTANANRNIAVGAGVTATIDTNNYSPILPNAFSGATGGLTITNSASTPVGNLTLSGTSTYQGATTIASQGVLNLTGNLGSTAMTVQSGGALTGTGSSGGSVLVNGGGTINAAAALSTKSLTVNGLTLGNSSTYTGGQYATTNFTLGTRTNVEAIIAGALTLNSSGDYVQISGTATSGSTYVLMNYASGETLNGAFSLSSTTPAVTTENVGRLTYTLTDSGTQLDLGVAGFSVPTVAYWYGGAGTTVWDDVTTSATLTNWSTDLPGTVDAGNTPGAFTDVILNASNQTGTVTTTLGQNTTINSLSVNGNGTNTINADVNGTNPNGGTTSTNDALTINAAAINGDTQGAAINVGAAANAFTINVPLIMGNSGANQTWTNASGSQFTVGGTVTGTAATGTTQTLTLSNTSTGGTTISGVISDPLGAGNVALIINSSGSGSVDLQGNNTFTGGLTLTAGTLSRAGGTGTSFGAGNITVNGGTMDIYGQPSFVLNNLSGTGGNITSSVSSGGSSLVLANTLATTFAGTIDSGIGAGITKSGVGTLALTGSNSYTGSTTLTGGVLQANTANSLGATSANAIFNGGTLQLIATYSTSRNFVVNSGQNAIIDTQSNTLTDNGVISTASGTGGLTKYGLGGLILNNTETYNGITTLNAGSVQLGALGVLPANTLAGGANLVLNGASVLDLNSQNITLTAAPTGTGGTITNTQNGTTSVLTIGTGSVTAALDDTTGGATGTGVLATVITGNAVTFNSSSSNFTGGTTINNGGTLNLGGSSTGDQVGSGAVTIGSTVGGSGNLVLTGAVSLTDFYNNFVLNGGTLTKQNSSYILGSTTNTIAVNGATTINTEFGYGGGYNFTGGAGKPLEFDGIISGSAALTINGVGNGYNEASGVFITNNSNTYSGLVTVNASSGNGVDLTIGGNTALQYATVDVVGVSTNTGQVPYGLAFTGGTSSGSGGNFAVTTAPVIGALEGSGNISLQTWNGNALFTEGQGQAVALTTGGNGASTAFSGILSGTGSLIKVGAGSFGLSGSNTFTGGLTVNAGTVTISGASGTPGASTGPLAVNNPNTGAGTSTVMNLSNTLDTTVGSLSGTIATPSSGTNTAIINNGGSGRNFTVNQTVAGMYAGSIAGAGNFTLGSLSTNTLILTGSNTYGGTTAVNAGTLLLDGTHTGGGQYTIGTGSTAAVFGGTGSTASAVLVNATATIEPGTGSGSGALTVGGLSGSGTLKTDISFNPPGNLSGTGDSAGELVIGASSGSSAVNLSQMTLNLSLINANASGGALVTSETFIVIDNQTAESAAAEGQFASITPPSGSGSPYFTYSVNYGADVEGDGAANDVTLTVTAVPEPGSLGLLALGGVMMMRRRRKTAMS